MTSPLMITSLSQGKLFGAKPSIAELEANGAVVHDYEALLPVVVRVRRWQWLAFRDMIIPLTGKARG